MSLRDHTKGKDLPRSILRGTFTYCADGNDGWSLLDTGTNHRWSRSSDANGDTLCVLPERQSKIFVKKDWQFVRVKVNDYMTSANILKTCRAMNMKPVCESKEFGDNQCRAIGKWHLAYPSEVRKHEGKIKDLQHKVKGAYFYSGLDRNGGLTLMNAGVKHVWSKDKRDREGDTFCVQHTSMVGHGVCNCPSVNSLMVRARQVRVICAEKRAREANLTLNSSNSSNGTAVQQQPDELGDEGEDAHDWRWKKSHMAKIAKEATPNPALVLGETMHSSLEHLLSKDCEKECGDVRGLVREIFERERDCDLLNINLDDPH